MLTVGSLFSGIGGFDLGFERAGMRTLWFCEQNDYCRRVLARHWPGVPCHPDVRALVADAERSRLMGAPDNGRGSGAAVASRRHTGVAQDAERVIGEGHGGEPVPVPVPYVDVLCGGFPCQDLSYAGKGAGIDGERSGLWREFARLIGELRPRYVVIENVPALAARGLDRVLADLAACGLDAEWDHLPASAFGAPHRRDRVWVVAYPNGEGESGVPVDAQQGRRFVVPGGAVADPPRDAEAGAAPEAGAERERAGASGQPSGAPVADADDSGRSRGSGELGPERRREPSDGGWWATEPDVGRVAHGIPARVDRLAALGNALVPQIAEWIGRRIVELDQA